MKHKRNQDEIREELENILKETATLTVESAYEAGYRAGAEYMIDYKKTIISRLEREIKEVKSILRMRTGDPPTFEQGLGDAQCK